MNNIFYNIVSIVVGVILIVFGILQIVKKKKLAIGIVAIVHSVLFIFLGKGKLIIIKNIGNFVFHFVYH